MTPMSVEKLETRRPDYLLLASTIFLHLTHWGNLGGMKRQVDDRLLLGRQHPPVPGEADHQKRQVHAHGAQHRRGETNENSRAADKRRPLAPSERIWRISAVGNLRCCEMRLQPIQIASPISANLAFIPLPALRWLAHENH